MLLPNLREEINILLPLKKMSYLKYFVLFWFAIIEVNPIFAQPSNDNCSGAILLMASPDYLCGYSFTAGTTENATDSGLHDARGGVGDEDVGFKF